MLRRSSYLTLFVGGLAAAPLAGQGPADTVRAIARLHRRIDAPRTSVGRAIWPGFHPESIPTLYVIPHRAKLLLDWHDSTPSGFAPLPGFAGAVWTDTQAVSFPSDRHIAYLSVDSTATAADVLGLALHEEFHSFERLSRREGRRFGGGENAMLVADYPVFDVENETLWAIEARLLRRAYRARTAAAARAVALRFLAVREARQSRLDSSFAEFERMGELNEGLAQYALLRGVSELGRVGGAAWDTAAHRIVADETALLDSLLTRTRNSVRRRFYATGSTMSLLLDRLAGPAWKPALVAADRTVQDELALVVGYRGTALLGTAWTDSLHQMQLATRPEAERAVASLRTRRQAQADSVLRLSGAPLVVEASGVPGGRFFYCGFDPQNLLQVGDGRMLHARFVVLCGGDSVSVSFEQPAVEDRRTGEYQTVIADGDSLVITAGGAPLAVPDTGRIEATELRIEAKRFTLRAPHATVTRRDGALRIAPRP
jgi:hypothetical protein